MSATALRLAIGAAFIGLVALAAPVHEAATDLEPAVPSALFLIAVVGGVAGHVARHPAARTALLRILRCERNAAGFLWRWGWVLAIVAFLLPPAGSPGATHKRMSKAE